MVLFADHLGGEVGPETTQSFRRNQSVKPPAGGDRLMTMLVWFNAEAGRCVTPYDKNQLGRSARASDGKKMIDALAHSSTILKNDGN